ncbi:MAG TPA: glycosyltransferase family 2 protein [Terriglobales bacterium]|nr:glycosyltransferase family 2 protein [Terriglobales bacterium]
MATLSVTMVTLNEEKKLPAALESVKWADEIIVVDSGSIDRTVEIARSYGAKVYIEEWKGFARQKQSALEKGNCDWLMSLDADESVEPELAMEIQAVLRDGSPMDGFYIPRKNFLFGRWIKHGGWYPDRTRRLVRRGRGKFLPCSWHETLDIPGPTGILKHSLIHNSYATMAEFISTNNTYSTWGAKVKYEQGHRGFSFRHILLSPFFTFIYNYFFRLGFLDGKQGFVLHVNHAFQIFWKYAKAWELGYNPNARNELAAPRAGVGARPSEDNVESQTTVAPS